MYFHEKLGSLDQAAGAFILNGDDVYFYEGVLDRVWTRIRLKELSFTEGRWRLQAFLGLRDATGIANPNLRVRLRIGNDSGQTDAKMFGQLKYRD